MRNRIIIRQKKEDVNKEGIKEQEKRGIWGIQGSCLSQIKATRVKKHTGQQRERMRDTESQDCTEEKLQKVKK